DFPLIMEAMDQPSVDGVNTWYASKAVSELGMKVVVSGLGGDELFQGYSHFRSIPCLLRLRKISNHIPGGRQIFKQVGNLQYKRTMNRRWNYLDSWSNTIEEAWWL